jgi:hypothetical protein
MRTNFLNQETPHKWFHNSDNYNNENVGAPNLFFNGDTIYSYGTHFPIAKKFPGNIVLFNIDSYSSTTAHHIALVKRAIPDTCAIIHVPDPEVSSNLEHKQNYIAIRDTFPDKIEEIIKGRGKSNFFRIESLNRSIKELNQYTRIFKLGYKQIPEFAYDKDKAEKAKKILAIKARKKREHNLLKNRAIIKDWQDGVINRIPHGVDGTYLRLKTDDSSVVETSECATMPLNHALLLFKFVTKHKGKKLSPKQFGSFSLTKINAAGDITIGCHDIKYAEMLRLFNLIDHNKKISL